MSLGNDSAADHEEKILNQIRPVISYLFAHCKDDNRPYLEIDIFGIQLKGLLDSGANNTILGKPGWDLIRDLGLKILPSPIASCSVANNQTCTVIGYVTLPISLEEKVKLIKALVIPELPHTIILGMDFWLTMEIVPDFGKSCWSFLPTEHKDLRIATIQSHETLSPKQASQLTELTKKYFDLMGNKLGCTSLVEHKIVVTDPEPIKQRYYRVSPIIQQRIDEEVQSMLDNDIIEPSASPWSSPVLLVPKKDGSYRFCVDYRKLNNITKKDAYPIPFISTILDKLRNAQYLSSIDIKSAYWQVPVEKSSRELTAFTIPGRGLFHFKRMPFGLTNSPATWQRLVDRILGPEMEPNVFVYLDDIIIATDSFQQHLKVLEEIFKRLIKAGLTVSQEKCRFCLPELKYLGYVVDRRGLHVDADKVKAILDIPPPKTVSEVRRVIGMASWYRKFIPSFASLIAPMTALLHKKNSWCWSPECERSFNKLKDCLVSAPVLSCPDFTLPFYVQTDASAYGIGAVLFQEYPDGEHVICYLSRSLTRSEKNYSVTERECLAVIYAVEKLRCYLEGYKFTVLTDHHSLIWLNAMKEPKGRLARWILRLQQFDFDIIHRRGVDNIVPDVLSRAVPEINPISENCEISTANIKDKWYLKMIDLVNKSPLQYPSWRVDKLKLYKYVNLPYPELREESDHWKLVIPKEQRSTIIRENHDSVTSGHTGVYKTFERLKRRYYWPKMSVDVTNYVKRCSVCLTHKSEKKKPPGLMGSRPKITKPWQMICIDLVGPLPRSTKGFMNILVVSDYFSKFPLFFALRQATASSVTKYIEDQVFLLFGVPEFIICDNGVQFKSREFTKMCEGYTTKILYNAAYHPQANPAERVNGVLKTMLASYVSDNHANWEKLLQKVGCAIRTSTHEAIGLTPFMVNFGREHVVSGQHYAKPTFLDKPDDDNSPIVPKILENVFNDITKRLQTVHQRTKARYDLRRRPVSYDVGSQVYRRNYALSNAAQKITAKLLPKYIGPFTIKRKVSPVTYELADNEGRSKGIWHVKDIKAHPPEDGHGEKDE